MRNLTAKRQVAMISTSQHAQHARGRLPVRLEHGAMAAYAWLMLGHHCPSRAASWTQAPVMPGLPALGLPALVLLTGAALTLAVAAVLCLLQRQRRLRHAHERLLKQLAAETTLRISAQLAVLSTHATLSKLVARQAVIKTGERRRIARDIHDDLGQNLLALKIDLSLLQMRTRDSHPTLHQQLGRVAQHVELTIRSMRSVVLDLQPIALDAGLAIGLERLLHEFSRSNNIPYRLHAGPGAYGNGASIEALLFRSTQEALANIARHAQASVVSVTLLCDSNCLTMTVCDNGVGMASGQAWRGCGLIGMQQRVAAAGGGFSVVSEPGAGTVLTLSIPLPARAAALAQAPAPGTSTGAAADARYAAS